jgi:hypothetical protein
MNYIIKYDNFNESTGISDSSEISLYEIWKYIKKDIENNKSSSHKYYISEIKKEINIEYNFKRSDNNICNGISDILNDRIILNIFYNVLDDEFIYYIKSVLFHELLHIHQNFYLKSYNPNSFSIGTMIHQFRNIFKTNYILYLLDTIYFSLPFEISAQLHQYFLYKSNDKEYDRIFNIRNEFINFKMKELNEMENLELDYIKMVRAINNHSNNKYIFDKNSIWLKPNKDFIITINNILKKRILFLIKRLN